MREMERGPRRGHEGGLRLVRSAGRRESPDRPLGAGALLGNARGTRGLENVHLPFSELERGLYISGKPRTGKSTAMLNLILEDFRRGRSACVIDPHGELIEEVLARLLIRCDADRERVLVFDPTNRSRPIGLDLLQAHDEIEEDRAIQFVIELVDRMTPPHARGPILYQGVRNSMRLLFAVGGRLTDIAEILVNKPFREERVRRLRDPLLRRYWADVWPGILRGSDGPMYVAYLTSKFSQFLEDRTMRNIFGQSSGLNVEEAIGARSLMLFDLSRGQLGNLNSKLLGLVVLHCVERAVLRRPRRQRDPYRRAGEKPPSGTDDRFSLYIDEAHEFDVENLRQMLTSFPKHGAAVTLANQTIEDLAHNLRGSVLGAMGSFLILRQGPAGASALEGFAQPRFDDRDLMNLPDHQAILLRSVSADRRSSRIQLTPPPALVNDPSEVRNLRRVASRRLGRDWEEVEADLLHHLRGENA